MRFASIPALILLLSGCAADGESDPAHDVATGLLTVDWSISGLQDPSICRQSDADAIHVALDTIDGISAGRFEDTCEAFRTSIELGPGDYHGDAVLLDASGAVRTTPVDLGLVRIFGDDELVVPIDFPPDSFY